MHLFWKKKSSSQNPLHLTLSFYFQPSLHLSITSNPVIPVCEEGKPVATSKYIWLSFMWHFDNIFLPSTVTSLLLVQQSTIMRLDSVLYNTLCYNSLNGRYDCMQWKLQNRLESRRTQRRNHKFHPTQTITGDPLMAAKFQCPPFCVWR